MVAMRRRLAGSLLAMAAATTAQGVVGLSCARAAQPFVIHVAPDGDDFFSGEAALHGP
jgi:hypothetical protein